MNYIEELCDYLEKQGAIDHWQVKNVYRSLMPSLMPEEQDIQEQVKEEPWEEAARRWGLDVPDKPRGGRGGGGRRANRKAIKAPDLDALLPGIVLQDAQMSAFFLLIETGKARQASQSWDAWSGSITRLYSMDEAALLACLDKLMTAGRQNIRLQHLLDILVFYARPEFFPSAELQGYSGPSISAFLAEMSEYTAISFTTKKYNWLYAGNERIRCLRQALIVRNRFRLVLTTWLRKQNFADKLQTPEQLLVSDHGFLVNYVRNHRQEAECFFQKWMREHSNSETLCELIEMGGFDPNFRDAEGMNILSWCPDELVARLVEDGVNPLFPNNKHAPFYQAMEFKQIKRFLAMVESKKIYYPYGETLLEKVVSWGFTAAVEYLLNDPQQVKNINARNWYRRTPLFFATSEDDPYLLSQSPDNDAPICSHADCIRLLLSRGADAKVLDRYGLSPLHFAALRTTDPEIFLMLLKNGADPNALCTKPNWNVSVGYSPGMLFVEQMSKKNPDDFYWNGTLINPCKKILAFFVNFGMNVEVCLKNNQAPLLHTVARFLPGECIRLMLKKGADPNRLDAQGRNALFYAVKNKQHLFSSLDVLLDAGTQVNVQDSQDGDTPMIAFCRDNSLNSSALEKMLDAGANVNIANHKGTTPLHLLCKGCDFFVSKIQLLLDAGVKVDVFDDKGNTPLHYAVHGLKDDKDLQYFISNGHPDLELKNHEGKTPLHILATRYPENKDDNKWVCQNALQCLLDAGAKIDALDNDGNTPLHLAALNDLPAIYLKLVEAGEEAEGINGVNI